MFHYEDNGFAVLKVKARGKRDVVPVVGHVASISAGELIHALGVWITDRTHGVQFKADFLKTKPPKTAEGIEKYCSADCGITTTRAKLSAHKGFPDCAGRTKGVLNSDPLHEP